MAFIISERKKEKFIFEGFSYSFDKYSSDHTKKFWRCDKRDSDNCKVRIHTSASDNQMLHILNIHSHGSDAALIEASKIKAQIKVRAETTFESPSQIINNSIIATPNSVMGRLPNRSALRKLVQRRRIETNAPTQNITDLNSINIPETLKMYELSSGQSEIFQLIDTGPNDHNRILVFGRESHRQWSHQMQRVYVDGSFAITPLPFRQVYVIMAERTGFVFPILYALLPNKQEVTYTSLLERIKILWPNFSPLSISVDFEMAAIKSVQSAFPNSEIFGCFFHLIQNIKRKVGKLHLLNRYNSDPEFSLWIRMVGSLAFVPPLNLEEAFQILKGEIPEDLYPLINWFEDNYLGRPNTTGNRDRPLFPNDLWSVYVRTMNGQSRTNNHVEAAHRRMKCEFSFDHPTLFKFIKIIKKIQAGRDHFYEQFVRGEEPPVKRTKYIQADIRILNIVHTFHSRTVIEYLRGLAHNFLME